MWREERILGGRCGERENLKHRKYFEHKDARTHAHDCFPFFSYLGLTF